MRNLLRLFALISAAYLLWVLLGTGYISDDAYNSMIPGSLQQGQVALFDRTWAEIVGWIKGAGRFYPLSFGYTYPMFYYVRSLATYKVISFCFVLASVGTFALFLSALAGSWVMGALALVAVPVFFQFRAWHDPLLGFAFLLPLVMLYMGLAFYGFTRFLDSRRRGWFALAIVAYLAALMTYEVSYLLCVCFAFIAWERTRSVKRAFWESFPFLALGGGFVVLAFALKSRLNPYYNNSYLGVAINWYFPKVYKTLLIQTYAALPFSYFLRAKTRLTGFLFWWELAFFVPFLAALAYLLRRAASRLTPVFFFGFGGSLVLIPAVPLAVSSGYQEQLMGLGWGMGYLPVYLQYFGMFLVFVGGYLALSRWIGERRRAQGGLAVFAALLMTVMAVLNLGQNRVVAHEANRVFKYPRDVLDSSLREGILADVPDGAILIRNGRFPADHTWNFTKQTGHIWLHAEITELLQELEKQRRTKLPPPAGAHRLDPATGLGPIYPVPSTPDLAFNLKPVARGKRVRVDLRPWQIYGFTFDYDSSQGKTGTVYLSRLDQLDYDPDNLLDYHLAARDLKTFDFATKRVETIDLGGKAIDFRAAIEQSSQIPLARPSLAAERFAWRGGR
jgi:hypothetical protein